MANNSKGFVLYQGASELDGAPVVLIATLKSNNRKTGNMVQTWILRSDMPPVEAVKNGCDASICGDCPLRGENGQGRACYVNVGQAPGAVYRAYKAGKYNDNPTLNEIKGALEGRMLRIGAYGDPAAVPAAIWRDLTKWADGHTGYTHQWRKAADLCGIVQASCDSKADAEQAEATGWQYFRVTRDASDKRPGELHCPADRLDKVTCERCGLCNGNRHNVIIPAHGSGAKHHKG
ncbi:MAG: hypothetical protein KKE29_19880 [Proteobacteria bacterium]|nr:hypothetical protein [Pseudomonadota bacterium]MBU4574431.1 hypothetical protein [Pseudomonadota bacterium]MBV1715950.1 hypothetical protein [Desulfarculus sp.]